MSKLAITTISIALLTASGLTTSNLALAAGHEDPQAVIEKLQQEKSVLLKRLNNAVAFSKDRAKKIDELQARADAEQERRSALSTRLNNINAFAKTSMDEADGLKAQLESEQNKRKILSKRLRNAIAVSKERGAMLASEKNKSEAMSTGISSALAVSKKRSARLAEAQALAESEQAKNKILSKRLHKAIAVSKERRALLESAQNKNDSMSTGIKSALAVSKKRSAQLAAAKAMADSERNKSKDLSKRLRNAIEFSKTRGAKLALAEKTNKQLSKRLRNAIAFSKSRAKKSMEHGASQGDWAATTSGSLNEAFGGIQGTTVNTNTDGSVVIQVGNNGLFNTGSTIISDNGSQLLSTIAQGLSEVDGYITIIGHTDNIPVGQSNRFSNNQELSFARAVSTLNTLSSQGINTGRLSAAGYGDDRPVADNSTPEGRQQNRRVEIVVRQ